MKKVRELIVPSTGLMKCKVCGNEHIGQLRGGGYFKRGSWQCLNGCRIEDYQNQTKEINSNPDGMNHIKFRAECITDVLKLRERMGVRCSKMMVEISQFPDTDVVLYTSLGLDEVKNEIRSIKDCHVMLQTIALEQEYTGERDYELE